MDRVSNRKKAIIRRRLFLIACSIALALALGLIVFVVSSIFSTKDNENKGMNESMISSDEDISLEEETKNTTDPIIYTTLAEGGQEGKLNPNFELLLLVNAQNPLPSDYDSNVRADLVTIDEELRNNDYVTDIHKNVYPFITEMVKAANADGVGLKVWSPFRSYATQKDLFDKQVKRAGGDEEKAATVVARPGTSEHNTGLCADFNMASDSFEATEMFTWMTENAENYGFVLRYPKDKVEITGVIYESWHWRFVGINHAKEMNRLDMCLEEYVEYLKKQG